MSASCYLQHFYNKQIKFTTSRNFIALITRFVQCPEHWRQAGNHFGCTAHCPAQHAFATC